MSDMSDKSDDADVLEVVEKKQMLPPRPGVCHHCAVGHGDDDPHNAESLYYQMRFYAEHDRWPTWADAVAHCPEGVRAAWVSGLRRLGAWTAEHDRQVERGMTVAEPTVYAA